jgi:hypothetical protein
MLDPDPQLLIEHRKYVPGIGTLLQALHGGSGTNPCRLFLDFPPLKLGD